jgi:Zn-dependent M28 family amino/carboxypeptidase
MRSRKPFGVRATLVAAFALLTFAPAAMAVDEIDTKKFRDDVTVSGILGHERALQKIANDNGGTRASGTPGYDASVAYVQRRLEKAGYKVTRQQFDFKFFRELAPAQLSQVTPTATDYEPSTLVYSGSADVTGTLTPIDVTIPPTAEPSSTSGCEASDFVPAPGSEPAIALIQRGTCTFEDKANNAQAAGYDAVIIFNEGQPGRDELLEGTLGNPETIPVVGASFADGKALYDATQAGPTTVRVITSTESDTRPTYNLLADTKKGDASKTVVVGAHLDSVIEGPGINDNGSGTSTNLEIAEELSEAGIKPRQKLRFAFWGAEELGLLGSEHYVGSLDEEARAELYANLNFDMLGSPNYVRFVYDGNGDGEPGNPVGPPGSAQIEDIFDRYYASQGLQTEPTPFDGRSDYGPFIEAGIPAGGLFSGAEDLKTPEQATIYGGTAGVAFDKNYHQAGDTITNLNTKALFELGDGAAHAALTLARTKTGFFEDGSLRAKRRTSKRAMTFDGSHALR